MGNEASVALATAQAKGQFNKAMKQANDGLKSHAKDDNDGLVGAASKKDANQRRRDRQAEFRLKQAERDERKSKISEKWAAHKATKSPEKKGIFGN